MRNYVIKGNICYSRTRKELCIVENGYVVCRDGKSAGVYESLPESYEAFPCYNYAVSYTHLTLPTILLV